MTALNFAYLNPTGTAYTVAGVADGTTVTYLVNDYTPGAVITGQPTVVIGGTTYTANNVLEMFDGEDLSQDTISGIQTLDASLYGAEMTSAQFNGFTTVEGGGIITVTTAGTDSTVGMAVGEMIAAGWGGTTLIGNSENGQVLKASLFGNDTLTAGNGTGDELWRRGRCGCVTGGSGGDTFTVSNGLAAGSTLTGNGVGNVLVANGDLSQATISGIQTLEGASETTPFSLSAAEFAEATTINLGDFATAATGGTYSFTGKTVEYDYTFTSAQNTTIIGNDMLGQPSSTLIASGSGNDTLSLGDGSADILSATGNGNDILSAGAGGSDTLTASGDGNDTLSAGIGAGR